MYQGLEELSESLRIYNGPQWSLFAYHDLLDSAAYHQSFLATNKKRPIERRSMALASRET